MAVNRLELQLEVQHLDTALREERDRAKQVIGALEVILDEVRGHVTEIDRTRRAVSGLTERLVSLLPLEPSVNGHVEGEVLSER